MKEFKIKITDLEYKALADALANPDEWVKAAVKGKVNKCKKLAIRDETAKLLADPDVENIPATEDGILEIRFARADYKNRADRESGHSEGL